MSYCSLGSFEREASFSKVMNCYITHVLYALSVLSNINTILKLQNVLNSGGTSIFVSPYLTKGFQYIRPVAIGAISNQRVQAKISKPSYFVVFDSVQCLLIPLFAKRCILVSKMYRVLPSAAYTAH